MFVLLSDGRAWKLRKISAGTQRAVRAGTETRPYKKAPCLPLIFTPTSRLVGVRNNGRLLALRSFLASPVQGEVLNKCEAEGL